MSYSPYLLKGQKALVTGASSGLGEASARCLAKAGASVVVNYHTGKEEAEKIIHEIIAGGGDSIAIGANGITVELSMMMIGYERVSTEAKIAQRAKNVLVHFKPLLVKSFID